MGSRDQITWTMVPFLRFSCLNPSHQAGRSTVEIPSNVLSQPATNECPSGYWWRDAAGSRAPLVTKRAWRLKCQASKCMDGQLRPAACLDAAALRPVWDMAESQATAPAIESVIRT